MFNIRCYFQPHTKGVIADLTVTTTMPEQELGAFIASLAEVAMQTPGVEAVWRMVDHRTGKVCLAGPQPWEEVRQMLITKLDPTTDCIPFPLPDYIAARVEAIGHSTEHVLIEMSLNYRGAWTTTRGAEAWVN